MKLLLLLLLAVTSLTIKSQTYYIVRHAEKVQATNASMMATSDNPPLTGVGKERAKALSQLLKDKHIGFIFSTNTLRTISTAKPLSEATGIKILTYSKPGKSFIDTLKALHKNTLVVGHSNTVDDIVNALSETENIHGDLEDTQYDNLYVVTIKGKKISFKALKYGKASK